MCYLLALRTNFVVAFRTLRVHRFNGVRIYECKAFLVVAIYPIFRVPFKFFFPDSLLLHHDSKIPGQVQVK
jgi:hypothetical protein